MELPPLHEGTDYYFGGNEERQSSREEDLINSASELYGACRHRPSFHRYSITQPTSTDEGHTSP